MSRDFHAPGRSPVYGTNGMAATSMPVATLAALDMLRAGGNAMDGAIAAAAVLAVVEPQSTGIGGDCFCLYAPAGSGRVVAMNGSGRAPAAATVAALRGLGLAQIPFASAHAVTVPGAVSAWAKLAASHGRLGLEALLQPAIRCAEEGWPVAPRVASDWAGARTKLARTEAAGRRFLPGGATPAAGLRFRQPELGRTLRAIAARGPAAFYEGAAAAGMVASLRADGGLHTEADFAAGDAAEFVTPISAPWRGLEVVQCPPNGSGLLVLMILGMLEGFSPPSGDPLDAARLHRHIEAARLAYRDRDAFLGDPAQVEVPVDRLLSPGYLASLRALISDERAMAELPPAGAATELPPHRDTVYLCVVDRDGNACSFINSLFESFGSGLLDEASGVMLHNRGASFRLEPGHPNAIAPGRRPMHTIIPGMVMQRGEAIMPFGVMGGHFQPMGQTLLLSNHFEYGLDLQASLDLARLFPREVRVQVERGIPPATVERLNGLGHVCEPVASPHGGGQAIRIDREAGVLVGGSDPRKDGCAMGY